VLERLEEELALLTKWRHCVMLRTWWLFGGANILSEKVDLGAEE